MLYILIAMLLSLAAAGGVVLFVAYPHRGAKVPSVPWLGTAIDKAADAAPVIEDEELDLLRRQ